MKIPKIAKCSHRSGNFVSFLIEKEGEVFFSEFITDRGEYNQDCSVVTEQIELIGDNLFKVDNVPELGTLSFVGLEY